MVDGFLGALLALIGWLWLLGWLEDRQARESKLLDAIYGPERYPGDLGRFIRASMRRATPERPPEPAFEIEIVGLEITPGGYNITANVTGEQVRALALALSPDIGQA